MMPAAVYVAALQEIPPTARTRPCELAGSVAGSSVIYKALPQVLKSSRLIVV